MKVLLVNNPSPVPGGPEVVVAETERLLGAAGHHPALFRSVPRETVPSPLSRLR